jgi:hypothetical protein
MNLDSQSFLEKKDQIVFVTLRIEVKIYFKVSVSLLLICFCIKSDALYTSSFLGHFMRFINKMFAQYFGIIVLVQSSEFATHVMYRKLTGFSR